MKTKLTYSFVGCVLVSLLGGAVLADYACVCNYNIEKEVVDSPNAGGNQPFGFLYEFDCKPKADSLDHGNYLAIMFLHRIGYIEKDDQVQEQICPGTIPDEDLVTTRSPSSTTTRHTTLITDKTTPPLPPSSTTSTTRKTTTLPSTTSTTRRTTTLPSSTSTTRRTTTPLKTTASTTPKKTTTPLKTTSTTTRMTSTSTTTPRPTTPSTTRPITTARKTTQRTTFTDKTTSPTPSMPPTMLEGRTDLCPDGVKTDVNRFHGFLGQYGQFCYELVNVSTQWHNAQRHCMIANSGDLVDVVDQAEQNYLVRFLARHHYLETVWLGMTDYEQEGAPGEGQWIWSSGSPVTYNNFGADYNSHSNLTHKIKDCIVMKQGGEWTDVPCGVSLIIGAGFGEKHPFICQYNLTSTLLELPDLLLHGLVG